MDTLFKPESAGAPTHSDFTVILGCVFLCIVLIGGLLGTTRFILTWGGLH